MALNSSLYPALKSLIINDAQLHALLPDNNPTNSDGADAIATLLDVLASPDYWVWRTNVTRAELYHAVSVDGTSWSWALYKAQSQGEQGAWVQMFMGDQANFSLPNLRAGVANIFSGAASANNTHCLAVGRRKATRAEKALAAGTGSTASPAVMGFEGRLTYPDVLAARNS